MTELFAELARVDKGKLSKHLAACSSNVLLDAINQAKLCDFGFSLCQEVGPSGRPQTPQAQDANVMTLTVGYAAPEYIAQGAGPCKACYSSFRLQPDCYSACLKSHQPQSRL